MAKNSKNNRLIWAAVLAIMALVGAGVFMILKSVTQTETYYILNTDVSSRIEVTPDMLDPIQISKGSDADNVFNQTTLTVSDIQSGGWFSKHPLSAGDMLTTSSVGPYEDIASGVPDEWVVTSFSVSARNALGGRITPGTYFDIMIATQDYATYPFVNVLALDATSSTDNPGLVETEAAYSGEISEYVVAMSPEDAAKLHNIMAKYGSEVKLLLSPRQNGYEAPQISEYDGMFTYEAGERPKNLGEDTDYTFTPKERDLLGRPIPQEFQGCSDGNAQLSQEDCERAEAEGLLSGSPSIPSEYTEDPTTEPSEEETTTDEG